MVLNPPEYHARLGIGLSDRLHHEDRITYAALAEQHDLFTMWLQERADKFIVASEFSESASHS